MSVQETDVRDDRPSHQLQQVRQPATDCSSAHASASRISTAGHTTDTCSTPPLRTSHEHLLHHHGAAPLGRRLIPGDSAAEFTSTPASSLRTTGTSSTTQLLTLRLHRFIHQPATHATIRYCRAASAPMVVTTSRPLWILTDPAVEPVWQDVILPIVQWDDTLFIRILHQRGGAYQNYDWESRDKYILKIYPQRRA
jgi:hypothetical protein